MVGVLKKQCIFQIATISVLRDTLQENVFHQLCHKTFHGNEKMEGASIIPVKVALRCRPLIQKELEDGAKESLVLIKEAQQVLLHLLLYNTKLRTTDLQAKYVCRQLCIRAAYLISVAVKLAVLSKVFCYCDEHHQI